MGKNINCLLTGSTGLLGLSIIRSKPSGINLFADYYNFPSGSLPYKDKCKYMTFDIRDKGQILDIFRDISCDMVIHAASIGNVDYCESHKDEAWQTNVEGSRNIMEAAKRYGSFVLFMSSNAVFDGEHPPYKETDKPNPIDYYGKTKLQTETDLAVSGVVHATFRLMTMYGWNHPLERQNPVTWALERLIKGKHINIVNDVYNNHLFVEDAARAVWAAALKKKSGIFHIAGNEVVSRYQLIDAAAEAFGLDKGLVVPVPSSFFPSIAPRPKNTSYDITKMKKELGVVPLGVTEGLKSMKANPPREYRYDWM